MLQGDRIDMAEFADLARTAPSSFMRWWLGELSSFMPVRLRSGAHQILPALVLDIREDETILKAQTSKRARELGRTGNVQADSPLSGLARLRSRRYRRWPVVVRLAGGLGLRKTVDLPIAAKNNLGNLLRFELDRLTPFKAEEVCFAWRILETRQGEGRMTVALEMAPKTLVERAVERVGDHGRSVSRVEIENSNDQKPINLLSETTARQTKKGWISRILPLLVFGLAAVAAWLPIDKQRRSIERLDQQIVAIKGTADETLALRKELDSELSKTGFLANAKNDHASMTWMLAELTALLPDQSYLIQLEVNGNSIRLQGLTDKASDLIAILDQSAVFSSPQFRSPVTRDQRSGKERFQITIEFSGEVS